MIPTVSEPADGWKFLMYNAKKLSIAMHTQQTLETYNQHTNPEANLDPAIPVTRFEAVGVDTVYSLPNGRTDGSLKLMYCHDAAPVYTNELSCRVAIKGNFAQMGVPHEAVELRPAESLLVSWNQPQLTWDIVNWHKPHTYEEVLNTLRTLDVSFIEVALLEGPGDYDLPTSGVTVKTKTIVNYTDPSAPVVVRSVFPHNINEIVLQKCGDSITCRFHYNRWFIVSRNITPVPLQ